MDIRSTPLAQLKDPSLLKTAALVNGQWLDGSIADAKIAGGIAGARKALTPPSPPTR